MRPRVTAATTLQGLGRGEHSSRDPEVRQAPAASRPTNPGAAEFERALEAVSREIRDPVGKLRYIRGSLALYRRAEARIGMIPWGAARRALYARLSRRALEKLRKDPAAFRPPAGPLAEPARPPARNRSGTWMTLAALVPVAVVAALLWPRIASQVDAGRNPTTVLAAGVDVPVEPVPEMPDTAPTAGVWLVESGDSYEQYSNGLRIDTHLAVEHEPRRYQVFDRTTGQLSEVRDRPSGILFHTSESDIWPMEEAYNEDLRDSSQRLLRYIQRKRLYNYVVDRFGRVFRIVEETSKANHAGHSIWAAGDSVHLNLNHAFLGVCFETRWEGGHALPITQAQLAGGRALTAWLRERWEVPSEMCTTHGIASVNPTKRLIGRHLDWARGFPFEAFGLPDIYGLPTPSVAIFGFGYDDDFLSVMGRPWPGVARAERDLKREAADLGITSEQLRRDKHRLYDRWREEQARAEEAEQAAAQTQRGG